MSEGGKKEREREGRFDSVNVNVMDLLVVNNLFLLHLKKIWDLEASIIMRQEERSKGM